MKQSVYLRLISELSHVLQLHSRQKFDFFLETQ